MKSTTEVYRWADANNYFLSDLISVHFSSSYDDMEFLLVSAKFICDFDDNKCLCDDRLPLHFRPWVRFGQFGCDLADSGGPNRFGFEFGLILEP